MTIDKNIGKKYINLHKRYSLLQGALQVMGLEKHCRYSKKYAL